MFSNREAESRQPVDYEHFATGFDTRVVSPQFARGCLTPRFPHGYAC